MTRLRAMTAEDLPAVHALEQQLFPIDAWPLQMFRDELGQPATRWYLVAEESAEESAEEPAEEAAEEAAKEAAGESADPSGEGPSGEGPVGATDGAAGDGAPGAPRIVGYAGLMCVNPLADVQTIAVVPDREGHGIGTALLTALIEEARRRGADDVLLEVRRDNPRAQRLYDRHGFEQIHVRPRYYRDGVDALIMRKHLRRTAPGTRQDDR